MLPLANTTSSHLNNNIPSAPNSTRDPTPPIGGLSQSRRMVAKYYSSLRKSHNQLATAKGRSVDNQASNMSAGTPTFPSESLSFPRPVSEPRLHTQPYPPVSQLSNLSYSSSETPFSTSSLSSNQIQMNTQDFNQYQALMTNFHNELYLSSFADPTNFDHILANPAYQSLSTVPASQPNFEHVNHLATTLQHAPQSNDASSQSSRSSSIDHEDDDNDSGGSKMQFVVSTTDSVATELYLEEILPRKKRAKTTTEQLQYLREAFEQDHLPTAEARQAIAEKINMTPQAVRIWFQNARAKVRNETLKAGKTQSAFIDASKSSPPPQIPIQTFELFTKTSKQSKASSSQNSQSLANLVGVQMTFDTKPANPSELSISQYSANSSLPTPPQSFTNSQGSLSASLSTPAQSYSSSQGSLASSLPTPAHSYTSSKVFPNVASNQQLSLLRDSSLATSLPFAASLYSNYDPRDNGRGSQIPLHFPVEGWDVAKQEAGWGYNLDFSSPTVSDLSSQGVDRSNPLVPQRVGGDALPRSPSSLPLPSLLPSDPSLGPSSVDTFLLESQSSGNSDSGLYATSGMTQLNLQPQPLPPLLGVTTATSMPLMVDATTSLLGLCQPLMASLYSFPEMFSNINNNHVKATNGPKLVNGYLQN